VPKLGSAIAMLGWAILTVPAPRTARGTGKGAGPYAGLDGCHSQCAYGMPAIPGLLVTGACF
jgi:hypothetical protein